MKLKLKAIIFIENIRNLFIRLIYLKFIFLKYSFTFLFKLLRRVYYVREQLNLITNSNQAVAF